MGYLGVPLVVLLLGAARVSAEEKLELEVDTSNGAFKISFGGTVWLSGKEYRVGKFSSTQGSLALVGANTSHGSDALGAYKATTLNWAQAEQHSNTVMYATFREYPSDPGLLTFEQHFPAELDMEKHSPFGLAASTIFPGFQRGDGARDMACFAYHSVFPTMKPCSLATYAESREGGTPLVILNVTRSLPMVVFSPLDNAMAHHMAHSELFFGAGVKATVKVIPAGWKQRFVLSAGHGINAGMMAWGDRMLRFNGKRRVDNRYRDDVHGAIGFWTDNGGYYHYSIGNDPSLGKNYEEVLQKVKAYHDELGVPFKHWQFDSWFYPKDGSVGPGGGGAAVTNWTAMPSVFPHGMVYIQEKLGLPMVMHNRAWSKRSDYIHNWTDIEWYTEGKAAIPKDPVKFFDRFFQQQKGWGLSMYEQDWMNEEYEFAKALQTNISLGDLWLYAMAAGAESSNRTVQYCMPYPNEVLSAAGLPAVTNARATGDYFHAPNQWAVGATSLFYWALGILPFKDGFYSSTLKQVGGQTVGPERHPDREALMATLSAAMVGPMDGIGLLNKSRVMASCRADGTVLKPDRPATTSDACFSSGRPLCHVFETFSDVKGLGRVHYYYNDQGSAPLLSEEVYVDVAAAPHVVCNWYTRELALLQESNRLTQGYEGHIYAVVVPVIQGWALLGELRAYVPLSTLRFSAVSASAQELTVQMRGVQGEQVEVCAARVQVMKCEEASFGADGTAELSFQASQWDTELVVLVT